MPTDSAKKARVVVDRDLIEQAQAEAVRRGLGEKSPSLLVDMTLRAWLRSGPDPVQGTIEAPPESSALAERVAELESNLAALAEQFGGRLRALEEGKPPSGLPANTGRRQVASKRLPDTLRLPGGSSGDLFTPAGLRAAMKAKGFSNKSLGEALGMKDRGRQVGRWLRGETEVPEERRAALRKFFY